MGVYGLHYEVVLPGGGGGGRVDGYLSRGALTHAQMGVHRLRHEVVLVGVQPHVILPVLDGQPQHHVAPGSGAGGSGQPRGEGDALGAAGDLTGDAAGPPHPRRVVGCTTVPTMQGRLLFLNRRVQVYGAL